MKKITFVLTSCGRIELLNKTLESFFKFNDYALEKMYLVEDSFNQNVYSEIKKRWGKKSSYVCQIFISYKIFQMLLTDL